jgi:hypothetical protein
MSHAKSQGPTKQPRETVGELAKTMMSTQKRQANGSNIASERSRKSDTVLKGRHTTRQCIRPCWNWFGLSALKACDRGALRSSNSDVRRDAIEPFLTRIRSKLHLQKLVGGVDERIIGSFFKFGIEDAKG